MQKIVYKQDDGTLAIVIPSPEAVATWGLLAIGYKDVPEGKPFGIIDAETMPTDLADWVVDDSRLTDGVGHPGQSFPNALVAAEFGVPASDVSVASPPPAPPVPVDETPAPVAQPAVAVAEGGNQ